MSKENKEKTESHSTSLSTERITFGSTAKATDSGSGGTSTAKDNGIEGIENIEQPDTPKVETDKDESPEEPEKPGDPEFKKGDEIVCKNPLIVIHRGEEEATVTMDLKGSLREFNSDALQGVDGFRVAGVPYKYKFDKTYAEIKGIKNAAAKEVADTLMKMIPAYTNRIGF